MPGSGSAPGSTAISRPRSGVVVALAVLALGGVAGAAPSWTGPVELSPAARVVTPELALNAGGDAVVVWNREEGDVCADAPDNPACVHVVEAITRVPGAAAWGPPVELARPGVGSGPRVALDPAGNAVAVWSHDIGEPRVLQASYRRGRSGPWDFPIDVSDERFRAGTQQVGMDAAGNVVVAWASSQASGLVVQARVRSAESGVWGAPVDVSRPEAPAAGAPSLAVAGGQAVLAWVSMTSIVQVAVWAGGWQAPVNLDDGALPEVDAAVAPSGEAAVVWSMRRGAEVVVRAAFRPAGIGWTSPVDVDATGRPGAALPQIALDPAGNAHAVWVGAGERERVVASVRSHASSDWSRPVEVSAGNRGTTDPRLAVDGAGNAVAAWMDAEGMTVAAIRPSGGSWEPSVEMSRPNVPTGAARLAMGPVGVALAVWSRFEPRRVRVEGAELGGVGPVLGSLTVPATGRAGVQIQFGVEPLAWAAPLSGEPVWSFGDGETAAGAAVRHVFARPGRYMVSVTQRDAAGGTSTAEAAITISARPPANVTRPFVRGPARVGATVTCHRGRWSGTPPIRFAYRWRRNERAIIGARTRRFRVRTADRGARLACHVTATNAAGTRSALSRAIRIR